MKKGPRKTVSVTLPQELYDILKERSQEDSRSISSSIRLILREYVKKNE